MNVRTIRSVAAMTAGALVAGGLALIGVPAIATTTWNAPGILADQGSGPLPFDPTVTSSADGKKLAVVWTSVQDDNSNNARVQSRVSADGGATWSATQDLSDLNPAGPGPALTASDDGNRLTVVYLEQDNVQINHVWSRSSGDAGATWSAPVDVSPNVSIDGAQIPRVASSADGKTVIATWAVTNGAWASVSTDGGATWSPETELTAPDAGAGFPVPAMSDNGKKIAVIWNGNVNQSEERQMTVSVSADTGASWSAPKVLAGPSETQNFGTELTMSGDGSKLHAIWFDSAAPDEYSIRASSSPDSGATWTGSAELGSSKTFPSPVLAASANGERVYAIWSDGTDPSTATIKTRTSGNAGTTWAPAISLSSGTKFAAFPQIATSADGAKASAVWVNDQPPFGAPSSRMPAEYQPMVQASSTTDSGSTWEATTDVSTTGLGGMFPALAMSADGTSLIAVWNRVDAVPPNAPRGGADQNVAVIYALGSVPPTPPAPPADKKTQKPRNGKGKPPSRIKRKGVTVITGRNARTNAGQVIRTRVRCVHGPAAAGETRYCTVIRGAKGKVSLRTYGRNVKVIVVQSAPPTAEYRRYIKRTVYVNGRKK